MYLENTLLFKSETPETIFRRNNPRQPTRMSSPVRSLLHLPDLQGDCKQWRPAKA